jgi:hypothetical protein
MKPTELEATKNLLNTATDERLAPKQVDELVVLLEKSKDQLAKIQRRQDKSLTGKQRLRKWTKHYSRLAETKVVLIFHHTLVILWAVVCALAFSLSGEHFSTSPMVDRMANLRNGLPLILLFHIPCLVLAFRLKKNPPIAFLWMAFSASALLAIAYTVWSLGITESPFNLYHENRLMQFSILMMLALMNGIQAIWLLFTIRAHREIQSRH